jgi:uncharacterized protein (DUF885 family)
MPGSLPYGRARSRIGVASSLDQWHIDQRQRRTGTSLTDDSTLDDLVDDFLVREFRRSPTYATALGADGYDEALPDLSAPAIQAEERADDEWLGRFSALADDALTADERIDRDLVVSTLRGRQVMRDWAVWRRNPDTYLNPGLGGVFYLFLHRTRPEAELVRAAVARLRGVPELLAAGKENLSAEMASPIFVQRAIGQARAGVTYARELVPAEVQDDALRREIAAAGEVAASAYEDFATWLEDFAKKAQGSYAIGEELYSALLQEKEGLTYGARVLRDRGQAAYDELAADMRRRTREIAGHDDWRALLEDLAKNHPDSPEAMRDGYTEWTQRAREFCIERELVTLPPGEECKVVPSPAFQRPILAVASYNSPPPFKPSMTGHFFVPYPPEGVSAEEIQQRLATNAYNSMPTISVHEAYPGHHWHLTHLQSGNRVIRKVLGTSYFAEGWGLYSEEMMRQEGFFADPRDELCQVDARLFRAARIVVDTSLHLGEMSFEEAVTHMSTKASLSEPTARAEVGRYCTWPTQASSYLTGSLEIERIRTRWYAEKRGSLREFHDAIAGSGVLPISLAERAIFAD